MCICCLASKLSVKTGAEVWRQGRSSLGCDELISLPLCYCCCGGWRKLSFMARLSYISVIPMFVSRRVDEVVSWLDTGKVLGRKITDADVDVNT